MMIAHEATSGRHRHRESRAPQDSLVEIAGVFELLIEDECLLLVGRRRALVGPAAVDGPSVNASSTPRWSHAPWAVSAQHN
jgi:hypothetical protein